MTIDKERRKSKVLEAIIKAHIETAVPVGSSYIARHLGFSSATIRNAMADLEEEGYIYQPYTSAGRVPTDLGYRRYVDGIMFPKDSPEERIAEKIRYYIERKRFFEEVIEATSQAISEITNYTGIAMSPNHRIYFDGTYHILEQPEFRELELVRDFLRAIEEREDLLKLMSEDLSTAGISIRIGRENVCERLHNCSIITSTYKLHDRVSGKVGVIGPMRMRYEKVVRLVEYLAGVTTEILERLAG